MVIFSRKTTATVQRELQTSDQQTRTNSQLRHDRARSNRRSPQRSGRETETATERGNRAEVTEQRHAKGLDPKPRPDNTSRRTELQAEQPTADRDMREYLRRAAPIAGLAAVALSLAVLTGWLLGVALPLFGFDSMRPNTAFCFLFTGAALYVLSNRRVDSSTRMRLATALAIVPVAFGFLTLLEHFFGLNLFIDRWLAGPVQNGHFEGRLTPLSALNFVLLGGALT